MIDAHAHLDDPKFGDGPLEVLQRAGAAGVTAIVVAAVDLPSSRALIAMAHEHGAEPEGLEGRRALAGTGGPLPAALEGRDGALPNLHVAVGFHPHEASKLRPEDITTLRALSRDRSVVAIGEIGLDYHYNHSPRDVQREAIRRQLDLAADLALPVVVHNRDAEEDMYPILRDWAREAGTAYGGRQLGMMHCFSGGPSEAERYLDLGFCLSIACSVTYPNAQKTREVVAAVTLDRLLTETDSPYLPPQTHRGGRNEPAHVAAVVAKIAELKGLPEVQVATETTTNARRLFSIGAP